MDLTDKIVKDTTQEHLQRFFADKELSSIVQSAMESYINNPQWMFDKVSLGLPNEQYGEQMKVCVFASEMVKSAFNGLRLAAEKKVPLQQKNEAR
jgi:hypothetical protein